MNKFKSILSVVALSVGTTAAWAGPRSLQEAKALAENFVSEWTVAGDGELTLVGEFSDKAVVTRAPQLYQAYYVFNVGNQDGFVIVSGDDVARPILAFGDNGAFDVNNVPENVQYWLDCYKKQIEYAVANGIEVKADNGGVADPGNVIVEPLLGEIAWDQGKPYNNRCPKIGISRCYTGCAATSMAQVMKYHSYPESGEGQFKYKTYRKKIQVEVELGATYHWDRMTPTYDRSSSDYSIFEVAQLMEHVGASLQMDYGTATMGGSGATAYAQNPALINNFHYNKYLYYLNHDYVDDARWKHVVRQELDCKRPLLYAGMSEGGGHSFVCDGYTDNDYYHFNWGWSGDLNGYYAMDALEPGTGGAGAGAGVYNSGQVITVGLEPTESGEPRSGFCLGMEVSGPNAGSVTLDKMQYARDERIVMTVENLWNLTSKIEQGKMGMGLFKGAEFLGFVGDWESPGRGFLQVGLGFTKRIFRGTLPKDLEDGVYQLGFCSQNDGEAVPTFAMMMGAKLSYYLLNVKGDVVTVEQPVYKAELVQTAPVALVGEAAEGGKAHFTLPVKNEGGLDYYGYVGVNFCLPNSESLDVEPVATMSLPMCFRAYDNAVLNISANLPEEVKAGTYDVVACFTRANGEVYEMDAQQRIQITVGERGGVSIDEAAAEGVRVFVAGGALCVEGAAAGEPVKVFSMNGELVATVMTGADGAASMAAPEKGVYLVRVGENVVKVAC